MLAPSSLISTGVGVLAKVMGAEATTMLEPPQVTSILGFAVMSIKLTERPVFLPLTTNPW